MMRYAQVAVNAAVDGTFTYHIPDALQGRLKPGHLVRVGFGTAMQAGIVVSLSEQTDIEKTRPISELLDVNPVMTDAHIALGLWMSERYMTPPGQALWLMLPPGMTGRSTRMVHLKQADAQPENAREAAIVDKLRDAAPISQKQLERATKSRSLRKILNRLEEAGIVEIQPTLTTPTARSRTVRTVQSLVPPDEVKATLGDLRGAPKQKRIFRFIAQFDYPVDVPDVYDETGANSSDLNRLEERGLVQLSSRIVYRDSLADRDYVPSGALVLTNEQDAVWQTVRAAVQSRDGTGSGARFLLHGVTGSGKTEIYLHAIAETLARGRHAIFLVPEIALTPQTIRRVAERFPGEVAVIHGSLSTGERHDTWQRARRGEIRVIVGTRSALFTPLPDIGLIVLDEEHDHSYKHAPPFNPPYYHARRVAEEIARLNDAVLILGSATPDVETRYRAEQDHITYLHLPSRIMGHRRRVEAQAQRAGVTSRYMPASGDAMTIDLPPVQIVDMRAELRAGNRSMFSRDLHAAIVEVLDRGEQGILFLNRRGQSSYVFCRDCGYVVTCPRCDLPLTYHRAGESMKCHHCGYEMETPKICPECNSERIRFFGAGTQQIEGEIKRLFPEAKTIRWDADTASKPDMHETILSRFVNQEAQLLIGTQMVAKGLDLPLVTLVGVVSADPGLYLPEFRASERAFQTLAQVAGRAGRGVLGGRVIIQTYSPHHPAVEFAATHDYDSFFTYEIAGRREIGYPPFRRLARVLILSTHPVQIEREAHAAADQIKARIEERNLTDTHVIGPAPCFFQRIDGNYRWQVLIRGADPLLALDTLKLRQNWYLDIDPLDLL